MVVRVVVGMGVCVGLGRLAGQSAGAFQLAGCELARKHDPPLPALLDQMLGHIGMVSFDVPDQAVQEPL